MTGNAAGMRDDLGKLIIAPSSEIDSRPWEPLGTPGVRQKVLWQSGDVVLGLIQVDAGAAKKEHTHHGAHHHILMTRGSCRMVGQTLDEGSYIYIPPGVPHAVDEVCPQGCEFFFTYRPVEVPAAMGPLDSEHGTPV